MNRNSSFFSVAQVKSAMEKAADDLYEMSKPLARYRDDEDLEILLKERERAGDPMLSFIKKKGGATGKNGRPKKGVVKCWLVDIAYMYVYQAVAIYLKLFSQIILN